MPKILVFDEKGNPLDPIIIDIPRIKPSDSFKKEVVNWILMVPTLKDWKDIKILFPKLVPAFRNFMVKNNKIIGQTYEKQNSLTKFFIYDLDKKTYKIVYLPTAEREMVGFSKTKYMPSPGLTITTLLIMKKMRPGSCGKQNLTCKYSIFPLVYQGRLPGFFLRNFLSPI